MRACGGALACMYEIYGTAVVRRGGGRASIILPAYIVFQGGNTLAISKFLCKENAGAILKPLLS